MYKNNYTINNDILVIHNDVQTIRPRAFRSNQLTQLTIGKNVETIGEKAFRYNRLTELTIPDNVKTIVKFYRFL